MAKRLRPPLPRVPKGAYEKSESTRTASDWRAIAEYHWKMQQAVTARYRQLADKYADTVALLGRANEEAGEALALVDDYAALLREATQIIRDHPAATKLRQKVETLSQRQRKIASAPRKRTAAMREHPPSFFRAKRAAYVKEYKTARGWLKLTAGQWDVSTKTLSEYMAGD